MSDTSKIFIKMCNCPEIQKDYIPKIGDWVYFNGMTEPEEMVVHNGEEHHGERLRPWCDYSSM